MGRVPLPGKSKHSETNWNFENARPSTFFSVKIKLNFHRKKSARASKIEKRIKILLARLVLHGAPVSNVTD